jgi:hypothetical protein|nr:MAG TPA: hypothetical protein [Caudoviricetes sp.]
MTKSTIIRERLEKIKSWRETYGAGSNVMLPAEEAEELARMALAAMDSESGCLPLDYLQGHKDGLEWAAQLAESNHPQTGDWLYDDPIELAKAIRKGPDMPPAQPVADSEPVAWTWHYREQWHVTNDKCRAEFVATDGDVAVVPLYRHAQPAQISEPVLPLQDKDLQGVIDALEHPAGINTAGKQVVRLAMVELQERRKADSEPVAEVVSIYGDPEAFGEREIRPLVGIQQMPYGTKLYRHAQPVLEIESEPVFTLEVARADYKGQKLGNHFGFITLDAARELKEGNYQLYTAQPAPVVPDDVLDALQKVARIRLDLNGSTAIAVASLIAWVMPKRRSSRW